MKNTLQIKFDQQFNMIREKSIGIYGIGKNAHTILENVKGYKFSCLIAQEHLYDSVDGLTVLPLEEALKQIEVIIIAAIPSSTAIVYNRIKDDVPDSILIYDMQGYLLRGDDNYKDNPYWDNDSSKLKKLIDSHEVISFDIFDTLITRTVLFPRDVFDLMNGGEGFKDIRISAEEELYKKFESPSLTQIYELISSLKGWSKEEETNVKAREISVEEACLIPRNSVLEMFKYAVNSGKKVYLTSDMYLEKTDLIKILGTVGISEGFGLLVSSEFEKTKETGELYDVLLEKNPGKGVLHIGDNELTDIERAKEKGIDTFYVKKGYDILAESACAYIFDLIQTEDDKFLLGNIVSELFNDPFSLCETKGKLNINNYSYIAACILPITLLYISKIIEWAKDYEEVLFASRDGYFLYVLYEWYRKENQGLNLPEGKYIYVSRSAISSMAVRSEDDIEVFLNKIKDDPKLNLRKLIENQFHISLPDEFDISTGEAVKNWGLEEIKQRIGKYNEKILENAALLRERYLAFLKRNSIETCCKTAVVDVVTQGTLVYGLSSIFEKEIDLIALGTSAVPNKYINDISRVHSVFGNITERVGDAIYSMSDFAELHLFIEMLYASKEGQFYTIDKDTNPVFVEGSQYDPVLLDSVQTELLTMMKRYLGNNKKPDISPEFALGMLRTFSKKFSVFSEEIKKGFTFEDQYDGIIQKCNLIDFIQ